MSIHRVDVVKINSIENHPDSETVNLGIARVGGFSVIVNKTTFNPDIAYCYIQPDSLVPVKREEFAFLAPRAGDKEMYRVRVMKLRGFYSQGLLIPAPAGFNEGDDAAEFLGVEHYEPPVDIHLGGNNVSAPRRMKDTKAGEVFVPIYDVENYNRFVNCFQAGEEVVATEKIHGTNVAATFVEGQLYVRSRNYWKKDEEGCAWWVAIKKYPQIARFLEENEGTVVFGEVYGRVQCLRYGLDNDLAIALFDIFKDWTWLNWDESQEIVKKYDLPWVPLVYRGPFDEQILKGLAEQDSIVATAPAGSIREGIVVKSVISGRIHPLLGRVQLKMIGNRYLDKAKD
jgi:RNA ligase (TIGR02306 family)